MVRRMRKSDLPEIAQLERECFKAPWSEKSLEKYVNDKDSCFCVYEETGMIVGYAGMYFVYPEGDITNVAIKAEYRKRGYAREILCNMFEYAKERGITEFTLEVRQSNTAAIRLYEKLGFKTEGTRKNFYDNPKEDAYIMWKREEHENYN